MLQSVLFCMVALASFSHARPVSKTLHYKRSLASHDIPMNDPRLANQANRVVEQVHVNGGSTPESAIIVWVTQQVAPTSLSYRKRGDSRFRYAYGEPGQRYSFLLDPSSYYPVNTTCRGSHNYTDVNCFYTSGEIHSVTLADLEVDTTYEFKIDMDEATFSFNTGAAVGPDSTFSFGIIADLGQTENSSHTVEAVAEAVKNRSVDMLILAGDLSYADGDAPRWDTYARVFEPLFANVKTSYVGGNHEVSSGGENWMNYEKRYPNMYRESGSDSFLWYSFNQGPAHVVMLCSYAAVSPTSPQYMWLEQDLVRVDRTKTPWIIAVWHTPWYTSNAHHPMSEGAIMKDSMEDLLLKYNVNVVFNGHVHAYERTHPVAHDKVDCKDGITYITIGDGGNREQFAYPWTPDQPSWSALREFAYGFGKMHILNTTHAKWEWWRDMDAWNPNPKQVIGDETYIMRGGPTTLMC